MLSSWGESSSHSGASSSSPITDLTVYDSKVPLHQWRLLHQLPALSSLDISRCSDLTASPEIIQQLSSLDSLSLWLNNQEKLPSWLVELTSLQALSLFHCRNITSLPQWLGKLASLRKISIICCERIRSLPDSIQQLTKLKYLFVRGCPTLVEWHESKENKMKLAHIRDIKFFPISAKAHEEDIENTILDTTKSLDAASGSRISNKGKKPMKIEVPIRR